jgi:hypothetical protein
MQKIFLRTRNDLAFIVIDVQFGTELKIYFKADFVNHLIRFRLNIFMRCTVLTEALVQHRIENGSKHLVGAATFPEVEMTNDKMSKFKLQRSPFDQS